MSNPIREARIVRDMSEARLAELSGLDPNRIHELLWGVRVQPSNTEIHALVRAFNSSRTHEVSTRRQVEPEMIPDDLVPVEMRFGPFPKVDGQPRAYPDRDALVDWINAVCRAALYAVLHPRNSSKGEWRDAPSDYFRRRQIEELLEFQDELTNADFGRGVAEAGDVLAFVAMELDAAVSRYERAMKTRLEGRTPKDHDEPEVDA